MFYHLHGAEWPLALLAALSIGMSKAGFSGVAMISVLVMASILPARESTGAVLPLLILADIFAVIFFSKHATARLVLRLMVPAVLGIVTGWLIMPWIPAELFARLIGAMTLALVILVLIQKARPALATIVAGHPALAWLFGWLAGVTTMLANAAGAVMTIYLLACRLPKMEFVGTAAWFFFCVNLVKVPFSVSLGLINLDSLFLNLLLAPGVIAGIYLGKWLLGKINQIVFEWLMIVFTILGGIRLLMI